MAEAKTVSVKYIFLDVVKYSQNRSVEAQTDIIARLNEIVRTSAKDVAVLEEKAIYLPTGDGICIALLDIDSPYDLHLQLALRLLDRLNDHNSQTTDPMRRFQIRIGINANVDNLVVDINGNRNVAGAGINLAQRAMSTADANQILVGDAVFETLRHRERYMKSFNSFTATTKHNESFAVHQFVGPHPGLDISTPAQFRVAEKEEAKLTRFAAYYFAHAIKNREFLKSIAGGMGIEPYSAVVLLGMLAADSVGFCEAREINPYEPRAWRAGQASFAEQFGYYDSQDLWVITAFSSSIIKDHLRAYMKFFDFPSISFGAHFVTREGQQKLKQEWPGIWEEFHLGLMEPR